MSPALRDDVLYGGDAAAAADPRDMLRAVASSGAQVRQAAGESEEAGLPGLADEGRPRSLVVLATGSAATAGEVLRAVAGPGCPVPVTVQRGFDVPAWVGAADLVVALDSPGRSEGTLAAVDAALRRGCRLVAVGAEGSPLHERARQSRGLFVRVPQGRPPRADFWALATPLVVAASHLGLLPASRPPLPELLEATALRLQAVAERCRPSSDAPVNPAKVLATELGAALPLVWGTSGVTGVAAARFVEQLAENAKVPAVHGVLPDAAHTQGAMLAGPYGELAGDPVDEFFRDRIEDAEPGLRLRLVLLRDDPDAERPEVAGQAGAARRAAQERGVQVSELVTQGDSGYERLAELVGLTDYASVYLALLHGVDPGPVDDLNALVGLAAR